MSLTNEQRVLARELLKRKHSGQYSPPVKQDPRLPLYQQDPALYLTEKLGIRLTPDQTQICDAVAKHNRVLVKASHNTGKSTYKKSYITLADGQRKRVEELVDTEFELLTLTEVGIQPVRAYARLNEAEPIYTIVTESGRVKEVNGEHPLYGGAETESVSGQQPKISKPRWIPAGELSLDSTLAVPAILPIRGTKEIPDSLADSTARALDNYTEDAHIPPEFFELINRQIALFLSRLFSLHGWAMVHSWPDGEDVAEIGYFTGSHRLALEIQELLLRFGICSFLTKGEKAGCWLFVHSAADILLFLETMEIYSEENVAAVQETARAADGSKDAWRSQNLPPELRWERIASIEQTRTDQTVTITVPIYHTFLTTFFEHNCVADSEFIPLADGHRVQAKELVGTQFEVLTLHKGNIIATKAYAEWNMRHGEEVFAVSSGSKSIIRNANHPLWTASDILGTDAQWRTVGSLQAGGYIAATDVHPSYGTLSLNPGQIRKLAEKQKTPLPAEVFFLTRECLILFLRFYMAKWGTRAVVPLKKFVGYTVTIRASSTNKETLHSLRFLLLRFGVHTHLRKNSKKNTVYTLEICDTIALKRYLDQIGLYKNKAIEGKIRHEFSKRNPREYMYATPGIRWERITSVEPAGIKPTVAICVPHYETFLTEYYEHNSYVAAGLALWYFDCFNPSKVLTTAPNESQVKGIIWGNMRMLAKGRFPFLPSASILQDAPNHVALGITARDSDAFQGRHEKNLLIILDEAVGIKKGFWEASDSMASGSSNKILAICNPTDISSVAYQKDMQQGTQWHVITISALTHPNIIAGLEGKPEPYPGAISLDFLMDMIATDCTVVEPEDVTAFDFEFPIGSGNWYHPNALFESRYLGRWPTSRDTTVWSDSLWAEAIGSRLNWEESDPIELGVDVGRKADLSVIHARRGPVSIFHESYSGYRIDQTAGRIKQVCNMLGEEHGTDPLKIKVKVDADGMGIGVVDLKGEYRFVGIHASGKPMKPERYPNRRSELWFASAQRAQDMDLDLGRLGEEVQILLKSQLFSPKWEPDERGRVVVEPKDRTRARLGRSPDDADAFNLAYAADLDFGPPIRLLHGEALKRERALEAVPEDYAAQAWAAQKQASGIRW